MIRQSFIVVVVALVLGAAGDLHGLILSDPDRAQYGEACAVYEARARGARDHDPGEFVAFLGEVCAAAQASLDSDDRAQRMRAAQLLTRIVNLRTTIDAMNAERARGGRISRVTPSGEFLIAHRMGLMRAVDAWVDSGADFSLASYP